MRWLLVLVLVGACGGPSPLEVAGVWAMSVTDASGFTTDHTLTIRGGDQRALELCTFTENPPLSVSAGFGWACGDEIREVASICGGGDAGPTRLCPRKTHVIVIAGKVCLTIGCARWIDGASLEERDGTFVGVTKVYMSGQPKDGFLVRVVLSGRVPLPDAAR